MEKWPQFVEGFIKGLHFDQEHRVAEVFLATTQGDRFVLRATEAQAFLATDVLLNNIVDRIHVWDYSSSTDDYLDDLWVVFFGEVESRTDPGQTHFVDVQLQAIRERRLQFLKVEPVYGALVLVLAQKFTLTSYLATDERS